MSTSPRDLFALARVGLLAQQRRFDVIANNVANLHTAGYKQSRVEFQEQLNTQLETPAPGSLETIERTAGTELVATRRLFRQGNVQSSESPWHLAIQGEGFFEVQLPDGTTAYTRDGSFQLDSAGRLVTSDGYPLSPGIAVPPGTVEQLVRADGAVMVRQEGEAEPEVIATIPLARFTNPSGLERIGDNLFRASAASGAPEVGPAGDGLRGQIVSGALEGSTVDLTEQIAALILAQRSYTLMVRALETSDQMLDLANRLRA